jgi:FlaA1/EpsC-like NDP-sugar epimerase
LEGFIKRIEKRQPIACPSDVKRFFVSQEESGQICMLACILGKSKEIFFPKLDMQNDLIKFADILPVFLASCNLKPLICESEEDAKANINKISEGYYPVYFFNTNTSGEKLYEEFYTDDEEFNLLRFQALGIITKEPTFSLVNMNQHINELDLLLGKEDLSKAEIITWLKDKIKEFEHIETGIGLDSKM